MRAIATMTGFAMLCLVAVIFLPALTNGQGGKRDGGGGKQFDAGASFDKRANGRASIPISEFQYFREQLQQYVTDKGITNGMVTRQQYIEFSDQMKSKFEKGGFTPKDGNPGDGRKKDGPKEGKDKSTPTPANPTPQSPSTTANMDYMKELADKEFLRRDGNGDGKLNANEMPESLRNDLAKWDKNGDTLVDIFEFRTFFISRLTDNSTPGKTGGITSIFIEEEELDRKPVVFRAGGKMPNGLPAWFKKLEMDGQVPLFAWRKEGKDLEDFKAWDLNDDGFITADEAMKQQVTLAKGDPKESKTTNSVASSTPNPTNPNMSASDRWKSFMDRSKDGGGGKDGGKDSGGKKGGWPSFGGGWGKKKSDK